MQFRDLTEPGSYARFFVEMVTMFLIITALAAYLITSAYACQTHDVDASHSAFAKAQPDRRVSYISWSLVSPKRAEAATLLVGARLSRASLRKPSPWT